MFHRFGMYQKERFIVRIVVSLRSRFRQNDMKKIHVFQEFLEKPNEWFSLEEIELFVCKTETMACIPRRKTHVKFILDLLVRENKLVKYKTPGKVKYKLNK